MLTFLFWNMNRKPLSEAIAAIANAELVDILMLAECPIEPADLLRTLNREEPAYHFAPGQNEKIPMFARFPGRYLPAVYESDRISIRRLMLPPIDDVTLVVVHFPSKFFWDDASQMMECTVLANTITEVEKKLGHRRTILVGDLNMNPFEEGVVGAAGLHAVATRAIAGRNARAVQGRSYPFFYNPMWGHFGDASARPAGTYYYERAEHVNYFWNNFDQVLVRPELLDRFRSDQLRILDRAGDLSLSLDDGRPDRDKASDHFPLLFTLDL
ncbi:MAG TPA: endonuclease/exonuclease/phosphatase family protein [Bryobacteraceae bacterium]|nr:endonuclease/exonuclease/phosphatase family protein [Bryobacteraceae bacterium]